MATAPLVVDLATLELAAYEWNEEFSKGQPQAYRAQNSSHVTKVFNLPDRPGGVTSNHRHPTTVEGLVDTFQSVLGNINIPHGPSAYQGLDLKSFCAAGNVDILERGTERCVMHPLALLDDRSRLSNNPIEINTAGERRKNVGLLGASQLLQELRKKVCIKCFVSP